MLVKAASVTSGEGLLTLSSITRKMYGSSVIATDLVPLHGLL